MTRPLLLDLFCGAGGAAVGYDRAGFDVVGVDINPQPNYPFRFIQAEVFLFAGPDNHFAAPFSAIHASPPCQGYTPMTNRHPSRQPRLIPKVRELLSRTGLPWVIENVPGAPLKDPVRVCGGFLGLGTYRHRLFESNQPIQGTPHDHTGPNVPIYGKLDGRRIWTRKDDSELRAPRTLDVAARAMGIDWMNWDELRESIPPAYTEFIGRQLLS